MGNSTNAAPTATTGEDNVPKEHKDETENDKEIDTADSSTTAATAATGEDNVPKEHKDETGNDEEIDTAVSVKEVKDVEATITTKGEGNKELEEENYFIDEEINEAEQGTCLQKWSHFIENKKLPLVRMLKQVAVSSAIRPITTVGIVAVLSIILIGVGFVTNFRVESDGDYLWPPMGCLSVEHREWIRNDSLFPDDQRFLLFQINRQGDNVLGLDGVKKVFEVLDAFHSLPMYTAPCTPTEEQLQADPNFEPCPVTGVTKFWNHSSSLFDAFALNATYDDVIDVLSSPVYPDGVPVDRISVLGSVEPLVKDYPYDRLESAKSYTFMILLPDFADDETTLKYEEEALDHFLDMRKQWASDPDSDLRLELTAESSFDSEVSKGIVKDIPLMAGAFVVMGAFCAVYFAKCDRVYSRSTIGIGAVLAVLFSLMTGYGLLFLIGVPFTSLTQVFPFILVGIGLDDAFIIMGAFDRTDPRTNIIRRVEDTMDEIGVSIFVSTLTTSVAFMLGSVTQIPAIRWFCFYSGPCVVIDFIYQITFFIAVIVLDQRRIMNNRYDIFCCCKSSRRIEIKEIDDENPGNKEREKKVDDDLAVDNPVEFDEGGNDRNLDFTKRLDDENPGTEEREEKVDDDLAVDNPVEFDEGGNDCNLDFTTVDNPVEFDEGGNDRNLDFTSRLMEKYISVLLQPTAKICVLIFFTTLLVLGSISASKMKEAFDFTVLTPPGSYLDAFLDAKEIYATDNPSILGARLYSRDVDLSVEENRKALDNYIEDMVGLEYISRFPPYYWHKDFKQFVGQSGGEIQNMTFNDQMAVFLETEPFKQIYENNIMRDDAGNVVQTRTRVRLDKVDISDVSSQVDTLIAQREVAGSQPLNDGREDWRVFSYGGGYDIWEFYDVIAQELILTTALAISSVFIITLAFIPHPIGCLIVTFTVSMVFVDLLGLMQIAGLHVNSITSIGLVMSIGLVVDFVMHVVHIYFEVDENNRDKKVTRTLMTMGKSILIGGFSTFLGTLPLCLGSSEVFWTFFITFMGIVSLGVSHGIIFVPVVLSLIAPNYRPENPHVKNYTASILVQRSPRRQQF